MHAIFYIKLPGIFGTDEHGYFMPINMKTRPHVRSFEWHTEILYESEPLKVFIQRIRALEKVVLKS